MKYISNALWPKGTFPSDNDHTTDTHGCVEQAQGVCDLLERNGAGGFKRVFPLRTWVSEEAGVRLTHQLAERREAMAEQGIVNLKLRKSLEKVQTELEQFKVGLERQMLENKGTLHELRIRRDEVDDLLKRLASAESSALEYSRVIKSQVETINDLSKRLADAEKARDDWKTRHDTVWRQGAEVAQTRDELTAELSRLQAEVKELREAHRELDEFVPLTGFGHHSPITENSEFYRGGDGSFYWATATHYSRRPYPTKPEWSTHFIYFGK